MLDKDVFSRARGVSELFTSICRALARRALVTLLGLLWAATAEVLVADLMPDDDALQLPARLCWLIVRAVHLLLLPAARQRRPSRHHPSPTTSTTPPPTALPPLRPNSVIYDPGDAFQADHEPPLHLTRLAAAIAPS